VVEGCKIVLAGTDDPTTGPAMESKHALEQCAVVVTYSKYRACIQPQLQFVWRPAFSSAMYARNRTAVFQPLQLYFMVKIYHLHFTQSTVRNLDTGGSVLSLIRVSEAF
jgi:hypothetical protein